MNIEKIETIAGIFAKKDKRLSRETCLSEAICREVLRQLDNKDQLPNTRVIVDKSAS